MNNSFLCFIFCVVHRDIVCSVVGTRHVKLTCWAFWPFAFDNKLDNMPKTASRGAAPSWLKSCENMNRQIRLPYFSYLRFQTGLNKLPHLHLNTFYSRIPRSFWEKMTPSEVIKDSLTHHGRWRMWPVNYFLVIVLTSRIQCQSSTQKLLVNNSNNNTKRHNAVRRLQRRWRNR